MPLPRTPMRLSKMHGAGNDFVVLDLRDGRAPPSPALSRALADRHTGVGCDQILTIEAPRSGQAVASYRIWNSDGSAAAQCGNGARCIAAWLVREGSARGERFQLDSPTGTHAVERVDDGLYRIAMGVPRFAPEALPMPGFAQAPVYALEIGAARIEFGAVSMGNPHVLIEVDDIDAAPVAALGAQLQAHAAFPDSVNVGFVQVLAPDHVRLRVYERGAGETLACGSGACAAAAILVQRGRVARELTVSLPGGALRIGWQGDGLPITMTGPATFVFDGDYWP
ncbi:diaminopimelate epimerase [Cognatiluteimonas telluris]|jgi:diaminopimelate epimerase|uniref:diaminopimelate epimerase n=1 Tax=Cognatiluteimonas telluris TaxID=1104775 RepID=UPI00140CCF49|nr:diaminopimelate epimerase [Lysobacter telluris]